MFIFTGKPSKDEFGTAESPPSQTVSVSFSDHQTPKSVNIPDEEVIFNC